MSLLPAMDSPSVRPSVGQPDCVRVRARSLLFGATGGPCGSSLITAFICFIYAVCGASSSARGRARPRTVSHGASERCRTWQRSRRYGCGSGSGSLGSEPQTLIVLPPQFAPKVSVVCLRRARGPQLPTAKSVQVYTRWGRNSDPTHSRSVDHCRPSQGTRQSQRESGAPTGSQCWKTQEILVGLGTLT